MSSWFERIMTQFRGVMKIVEHYGNMSWKVLEIAWNLHKIEIALP